MIFVLPVPRFQLSCALADGDWVYFAGGMGTDFKAVHDFLKLNVNTGDVVKLEDLRNPCINYPILKL